MWRLIVVLAAAPAWAQAISGSVSAAFQGFNEFGVGTTRVDVNLQCTLSCPPSRPELHYQTGGCDAWFVEAPATKAGIACLVGEVGAAHSKDAQGLPAGSAFRVVVDNATCHCGNAIGEGGYIDITSAVVTIPPYVDIKSGPSTPRAGDEYALVVVASPKGTETVDVRFSGAGLDTSVTLRPGDFQSGSSAALVRATPTTGGQLTVTAKLMPYGASHSGTVMVQGPNGGAGGGAGGGEGGGAGGGGEEEEDLGCTAAPGLLLPLAALAVLRRRWR